MSSKYEASSPVEKPAGNFPPSDDTPRTYEPFENSFLKMATQKEKVLTNQTTNVLLLSASRSGGSLLGQLLNRVAPDTFYVFDPTIISSYLSTYRKVHPWSLC